jgi:hypothetical protein
MGPELLMPKMQARCLFGRQGNVARKIHIPRLNSDVQPLSDLIPNSGPMGSLSNQLCLRDYRHRVAAERDGSAFGAKANVLGWNLIRKSHSGDIRALQPCDHAAALYFCVTILFYDAFLNCGI